MSRRPAVVALAVSAALLSACGTGLQAQTYKETGRQDGASTDVAQIAVRNLHVTPPLSGSTIGTDEAAVLAGVLVNEGNSDDSLVGASSDAASAAVLEEAGKPVPAVPVPARGSSSTTWSIVLTGLVTDLHAGQYITVTLSFQKAGRTTVQVPVRAGDNGLEGRVVEQDPYGGKG